MKYKCRLIPMKQLVISPTGFVMPICNKCNTRDCTNPIENKKISILGVVKDIRVYSSGVEEQFVIDCMGFSTSNE